MDFSKYRDMFLTEAAEHLQQMASQLVAGEKNPTDQDGIAALFREADSTKGMAARRSSSLCPPKHSNSASQPRARHRPPIRFFSDGVETFLEIVNLPGYWLARRPVKPLAHNLYCFVPLSQC